MAIIEWYANRKKREQGLQPDIYQYDELPEAFRAQVVHIWRDSLGDGSYVPSHNWWSAIYKAALRELGAFRLAEHPRGEFNDFVSFFIRCEVDVALSFIQLTFSWMAGLPQYQLEAYGLTPANDAIAELNGRFKQHGIGYSYANGRICRIDSEYLHAEAVQPALRLLHDQGQSFAGPLEEFMAAHDCHRKGNQKDAIANALKAFESVLKAICTARSWPYDPQKDTARDLIEIVFNKGLIPNYLQTHFTALRSVLESGVPTVRNKTSGHGQGPSPTTVPDHLAAYALHMTAANIVMLVESHRAMP